MGQCGLHEDHQEGHLHAAHQGRDGRYPVLPGLRTTVEEGPRGVSVARSIVGWRWLYFAQQSVQITSYGNDSSNWIYSGTFATADGLRHPNSYRLNLNPGNSVGINALPDGCDRLAATISTPASSGPVRLVVNAVSPAQDLVLSAGANQLLNLPLNPAYYEAGLWLRATGPIAEPVVAEPRMHCSVNALKSY